MIVNPSRAVRVYNKHMFTSLSINKIAAEVYYLFHWFTSVVPTSRDGTFWFKTNYFLFYLYLCWGQCIVLLSLDSAGRIFVWAFVFPRSTMLSAFSTFLIVFCGIMSAFWLFNGKQFSFVRSSEVQNTKSWLSINIMGVLHLIERLWRQYQRSLCPQ